MAISEKIELLGKGLYGNIPDILTLTGIPTATELDYVGGEDFDKTMLDVIFPKAIEEDINFYDLLEIDYYWICRCLRILNYGPYITVNAIFCGDCGKVTYGEYSVDVRTVNVKALPEGFVNDIVVSKDEFLDFNKDVHLKLPTVADKINREKDKAFLDSKGNRNTELARICYSVKSIGNDDRLSPIDIRFKITNSGEFSAADYRILSGKSHELADFGLRSGGTCGCPKCHGDNASFLVMVDDRFFRPTLGDLRNWKRDRSAGKMEDLLGNTTNNV